MSKYGGRVSDRERRLRAVALIAYLAAFATALGWLAHWFGIL